MHVNGQPQTTIRYLDAKHCVEIIDQTLLPHRFALIELHSVADFCQAISIMQVRGAPLIGVTAAFGLALALQRDSSPDHEQHVAERLLATRPTAVNLRWAIDRLRAAIAGVDSKLRAERALALAQQIRREDIERCQAIGQHGLALLRQHLPATTNRPLNILTHCNAGWLATVDWGTALAPIYKAQQAGIDVHVWVDETRPRMQGASLTAWELHNQGIAHTVISDNTGGHLMQQGLVDLCLVGSDRTSANGDVCNKIGTYLKALAAFDNDIPFYVALPSSTIDWQIDDGIRQIPIEQRADRELSHIRGLDQQGNLCELQLMGASPVANYAFDVTPARLVTALITELGVFSADTSSLKTLQQSLLHQSQ